MKKIGDVFLADTGHRASLFLGGAAQVSKSWDCLSPVICSTPYLGKKTFSSSTLFKDVKAGGQTSTLPASDQRMNHALAAVQKPALKGHGEMHAAKLDTLYDHKMEILG